MPPIFSSAVTLPDHAPGSRRAKERLYVICQSGSWLLMLGLQAIFPHVLSSRKRPPEEMVQSIAVLTMIVLLGWLISHYTRPLVHRWRWKELGWRALVPRVIGISAAQSTVWTGIGYTYLYGIIGLTPPPGTVLPAVVVVAVINGTMIFIGWWCVYFCYHVYDRFNRLQIEQLRLATTVKEAELRALKSQVNPHFIFNALNSLRALIDEDPARARMAVTQLANLLRYSLQSAQAETVPFEEELRVVNDYLALEQVRHEERLRLRLDIEPAALRMPVPPLILQTLVENAVKYGISPRPEGGEITIVARCEDDQLRLRVTNPGELVVGGNEGAPASTGLGLKNAAERLRLSFGDRARLNLRAESASLVVAEVLVPTGAARC